MVCPILFFRINILILEHYNSFPEIFHHTPSINQQKCFTVLMLLIGRLFKALHAPHVRASMKAAEAYFRNAHMSVFVCILHPLMCEISCLMNKLQISDIKTHTALNGSDMPFFMLHETSAANVNLLQLIVN